MVHNAIIHSPMIHSIVQDGLIALGLLASLWLFLSLKRELLASRKRVADLTDRICALEQRQPEVIIAPPALPRQGMNLNRRVQAIRLLRRGEDTAHVAAALGIPSAEVELLVRVQALSKSAGA